MKKIITVMIEVEKENSNKKNNNTNSKDRGKTFFAIITIALKGRKFGKLKSKIYAEDPDYTNAHVMDNEYGKNKINFPRFFRK